MARCRDLRNGTVEQPFDEYSVTLDDGTVKTYRVARQPMPKPHSSKPVDSGFFQAISKRVSKHYKGWSTGPSTTERRAKRRVQRQGRKLQRRYVNCG